MIIASAPGRCSIIGGGTDVAGGSVLSCSTRERVTCTIDTEAAEFTLATSGASSVLRSSEDLALMQGDPLRAARAVLAALEIEPGRSAPLRLQTTSEIPGGRGLAESPAMLAALAGGLLAHLGLRLNAYEIAELIRKIDCDYLNASCGFEDHYMAVFGGLSYLDFRGKDGSSAQTPATPFATVESLDRYVPAVPLLVACWPEEQEAVSGTTINDRDRDALGVITFAAKRALLAQDWAALAGLMNRSREISQAGQPGAPAEDRLAAALAGGAIAAMPAGPAAVLALTLDASQSAAALRNAGATTLVYPHPAPGLTVSLEVTF